MFIAHTIIILLYYYIPELKEKYLQEKLSSSSTAQTLTDTLEDPTAATDAPPTKRTCMNSDNILNQTNPPVALTPSTSSSPQTTPHQCPIQIFAGYLKSLYKRRKLPAYGKWPPTPSKQFINLVVILKEKVSRATADDFTKATLRGKSDDIFQKKKRIHFSDLAKTKDGEPAQLVLVEGAPGIGKSTFAWEACRKWGAGEILQQYELMVLLRLREKRVQQATTIADLFYYSRNADIKQRVVEEIENSDGAGVLLVLEGFDELPAQLRTEDSLFMDIIKGERLTKATILVTSRHWASRPLLLNDELHRPLSQHIEILGFTRKDIEDYLECMTFDDPSLLPGLKQYLSCYPIIASMMYVPLNCAIVLEVYRESRSDVNQLIPKTMTELYTSLVRTLLIRYLHDHPECGDKYKNKSLPNFHDLPEPVYEQFCELARIAYEGICNDEQIIFTDLPDGFETLGLMQCVPELYVDQGAVVSYNFLHLTLQEFLAAYHVSLMPGDMQIEHFLKANDSVMMEFTAGLTKLDFKEEKLAQFISFIDDQYDQGWDPSIFYLLFEAQNANLLQKLRNSQILKFENKSSFIDSRGPFAFYMLGYCVAHSNCKWDILMEEIEYEEARMFIRGTENCIASNCGKIISLDVYYVDLMSVPLTNLPLRLLTELTKLATYAEGGWNDLAELVLHAPQLRELDLRCCTFPPGSAVQLFNSLCSLHSFTTLDASERDPYFTDEYDLYPEDCQALGKLLSSSKSLTKLDIHSRSLADSESGIEYISNGLKQSTLHDLDISRCGLDSNGAHLIADALCYNDTLRELHMSYNPIGDDGATTLANMLIRNQILQTLDMESCDITELGPIKLAEALCFNSTIMKIKLSGNTIKDQGVYALAQMLTRNQILNFFELQHCDITELGAIKLAEALCLNSTLTKIDLSDNAIKDQGACALAQMLTRNQSLSELDIQCCSISGVGASHLARALSANHSITHIGLTGNDLTTLPHSDMSTDPRLRF